MTTKKAKTTGKQRNDRRFKPGNKVGHRFKKGDPGGPGRPPSINSPRAQLKLYAERIAPEKLRKEFAQLMPELDTSSLTWAQLVALAHLDKAAHGDMTAVIQAYKQVDDSGKDTAEQDVSLEVRKSRATDELMDKLQSMAARMNAPKGK